MNTDALWPSLAEAKSRVLSIQVKLHRWATDGPDRRFDDLFNLIADPAFLVVAWDRVRGNRGARTAGVDGVAPRSIDGGEGQFLAELRDDLKARRFRPLPVRQRMIPKASGKLRSLGIPTARDRVVQASIKLVLEPIFEADFYPCSYGFRPNRRAQDAIEEIRHFGRLSYEWILEGDIKSCFDEISHPALMGRVRDRIGDKRVLDLVKGFLAAGVLSEDGTVRGAKTGTPQGGILSPLLANIALSVLDEHFAGAWQTMMATDLDRQRRRRRGQPMYRLVRYADDFVLMVSGTKADAEELKDEVAAALSTVGLRLAEEKTSVSHIDEGIDFLVATRGRTVRAGSLDWRVVDVDDSELRISVRRSVPTLTCVAGNDGVRSIRGKAQGRPLHPGVTGEGKTGRVSASEFSWMPRHRNPRRWDATPRAGRAAGRRQRRPVTRSRPCRTPSPRGTESTLTGRISTVWNVATPSGSGRGPVSRPQGRPNSPAGAGWSNKRMPACRKATGNGSESAPSAVVSITGRIRACARPERELTWAR